MLWEGWGVDRDIDESLALARRGAEGGAGRAMTVLGFAYNNGLGVPKNVGEAERWWRSGAEAGSNESMYRLGEMLMRGEGRPANEPEGLEWLRRAARAGHIFAALEVGRAHDMGFWGAERDEQEAYGWFRIAANGGIEEAVGWVRAYEARHGRR